MARTDRGWLFVGGKLVEVAPELLYGPMPEPNGPIIVERLARLEVAAQTLALNRGCFRRSRRLAPKGLR